MAEDKKYTFADLKEMQSWDLNRKILVTQTRITEWYMKNGGNVYVSFSGGKDSTVLLHIVRQMYPDVPAVFIDTGLEYPEIREFVKTIPRVEWVRPEMNFRKVIERYGYPVIGKEISKRVFWARRYLTSNGAVGEWAYKSLTEPTYTKDGKRSFFDKRKYGFLIDAPFKISDQCCNVMKKHTAHKYNRNSGRKPIIATMAAESNLRTMAWLKTGCNAFEGSNPSSHPMSFWTEQDVLSYIKKYDLPYATVYGDIVDAGGGYCEQQSATGQVVFSAALAAT